MGSSVLTTLRPWPDGLRRGAHQWPHGRKAKDDMKIEIKSRYDNSVLFAVEAGSLKLAVEAAVKSRASLDGASLDGASLDRAKLDEASLVRASLVGASLDGASLVRASLDGTSLDRARLIGASGLKLAWHVHHEKLWEVLTEPIENRIAYIKSDKPNSEQATRLRLLKPIIGPMPEKITVTAMEALHKKECAGCPWDGTTIFPY